MTKHIMQRYGDRVGYGSEDLANIESGDPRRRHIEHLAVAGPKYSIVAEVAHARHCNSGYHVGDRFVLDADGNFISKLCPKRICVYLAAQLTIPVALINERLSEGLEPNAYHFVRLANCPDCGIERGGYGEVAVRVRAVDRSELA